MPVNFPNSPSVGQIYTVGNKSWIYDGVTWTSNSTTPIQGIQGTQGTQGNLGLQGTQGISGQTDPIISSILYR